MHFSSHILGGGESPADDALSRTDRLLDRWSGQLPPDEAIVDGSAWHLDARSAEPGKTIVCFTARHGGTGLTHVAERLGFSRMCDPTVSRPPDVEVSWDGDRFTLLAFDEPLWSGCVRNSGCRQVPTPGRPVMVLIIDGPGAPGNQGFPRVEPALIWAAYVPWVPATQLHLPTHGKVASS